MNTSDKIALASFLFMILSSLWAIVATWKSNKYKKHIQKYELREYEEKELLKRKALIKANVYIGKIHVFNIGLGTARNIRFFTVDDWESEGIMPCIDKKQSYPLLHNGESFNFDVVIAERISRKSIMIARFVWDDDFANNNERDIVLNF